MEEEEEEEEEEGYTHPPSLSLAQESRIYEGAELANLERELGGKRSGITSGGVSC